MKHIVSKQDENQVYLCDMREYNGSTARELKFHVKSKHEYTCDECEYSTINRLNLMKHIVSKQDENQVYPCDWCKTEADSLINLKNHRERIHLKSRTAKGNISINNY